MASRIYLGKATVRRMCGTRRLYVFSPHPASTREAGPQLGTMTVHSIVTLSSYHSFAHCNDPPLYSLDLFSLAFFSLLLFSASCLFVCLFLVVSF